MYLTTIELSINKGRNDRSMRKFKEVDWSKLRGPSINAISEKTGVHHKKLKRFRHCLTVGR